MCQYVRWHKGMISWMRAGLRSEEAIVVKTAEGAIRTAAGADRCPAGFTRIRAMGMEGRGSACRQCTLTHPSLYDRCLYLSHDNWPGWRGVRRPHGIDICN